jgi:hypothetical protein
MPMVNLYDILQSAQGGQAMENLAKQFGLSIAQTQQAVEALLPAFSMGLKRQASEPQAVPNLFALMAEGYRSGFENPHEAATREAVQRGNEVLGALFGSKEVSRAVADQAAALSGIGTQVLQAMMPVVASMLMGGIAKTASSQPQFQDLWSQMMGGALANPQVQPNPNGGGLLGALLGSLLQQGVHQTEQQQASAASPPPSQAEMLGQLFETGRQIQQAHLDTLQSIFDAFTAPPKKQ